MAAAEGAGVQASRPSRGREDSLVMKDLDQVVANVVDILRPSSRAAPGGGRQPDRCGLWEVFSAYFERLDGFLVGLPVLSAMNSALIDFAHQFSQFQEAVEMARTGEAWT